MKNKFVYKLFFFLLIAYGLYWSAVEFIFLAHLDPAGLRSKIKSEYIQAQIPKDEVDYLILGDSSAFYSINPMKMGSNSYSAAELGATVALSKKMFQELGIKKINKGVIMIQTFIDPHYDEDIWRIFVPQKIMNLSDILSTFCNDFDNHCTWIKKATLTVKYLKYRLHLNSYIAATISYGLTTQSRIDRAGFERHVRSNVQANRGHSAAKRSFVLEDKGFYTPYLKYFNQPVNPPDSELVALRELAELVKAYGVELYLIHPQLYRAESFIRLEKYNESYRSFLHKKGNLNFHYIDLNEFNVVLDRSHYRDVSHLNEDGSTRITNDLLYVLETKYRRGK